VPGRRARMGGSTAARWRLIAYRTLRGRCFSQFDSLDNVPGDLMALAPRSGILRRGRPSSSARSAKLWSMLAWAVGEPIRSSCAPNSSSQGSHHGSSLCRSLVVIQSAIQYSVYGRLHKAYFTIDNDVLVQNLPVPRSAGPGTV
jgi:hypothetical protein